MFGDEFGGDIADLLRKAIAGENNMVEYSSTGPDGRRMVSKRMQRDVFGKELLSKVTHKKNIYFVFDFSGKDNVTAKIQDVKVQDSYGENLATGKRVIEISQDGEVIASYPISEDLKVKGFDSHFSNGLLEVSFRK
ncbi:hypothetical protein HN747_04765 [archaeon]|jgi:hypothetical protein|nr:hypothetical protein [archaeon]